MTTDPKAGFWTKADEETFGKSNVDWLRARPAGKRREIYVDANTRSVRRVEVDEPTDRSKGKQA